MSSQTQAMTASSHVRLRESAGAALTLFSRLVMLRRQAEIRHSSSFFIFGDSGVEPVVS